MKLTYRGVAYCGIASLALLIVYSILLLISYGGADSFLASFFERVIGSVMIFLSMIIFMGYYKLANRYDLRLLKVMSIIGVVGSILLLLFSLSGIFMSEINFAGAITADSGLNDNSLEQDNDYNLISIEDSLSDDVYGDSLSMDMIILVFVAILILFMLIIYSVYYVLFGFGILKLKDEVKYAKETGISYIVAGFTFIILIGFLVLFVAMVFEIMMFLKASERFDGREYKGESKRSAGKTKKAFKEIKNVSKKNKRASLKK